MSTQAIAYGEAAALDDLSARITALNDKLDDVLAHVRGASRQREELEELLADLMPALNGGVAMATRKLDELEKNGVLATLRVLAERTPVLLETAEALTDTDLAPLARHMLTALHQARKGRPPTMWQLLRARRDPRVRRGVAALIEMLRGLGNVGGAAPAAPAQAAQRAVPAVRASANAAACAAHGPVRQSAKVEQARMIAGAVVQVDAEGFMTRPAEWTAPIAEAIAAEVGLLLTPEHWRVIEFCRGDAATMGVAPGMRRITQQLGIPPKQMYSLFPKGPGILAARIAGLAKPKSCV